MGSIGRDEVLVVLVWFLLQQLIGLYVFTNGFFLTRVEMTYVSSCSNPPPLFKDSNLRKESIESPKVDDCWMEAKFDRVVLVIIDALRYDFVAVSDKDPTTASSYYLNHLPVLQDALSAQANRSMLLKFQADPPTMTMQRLKGITTGSLPTFLDIKDNMHSSEVMEDSIIKQMHQHGRDIVFMGDDTWDSLYGKYFKRNYTYDSFNVKDLDTVDNGVIQHLFPELQREDWHMLIAHFLGVDHVGHTFGPTDPHMQDKLQQMNEVLKKLMNEIDDRSLLVIMGDHGMSEDGNHGGATDEETGAALFLYSKKKVLHSPSIARRLQMDPLYREVPQVDIVPTLSLLLGLPIPFGNLGAVIPQLFFNESDGLDTLNQALELNIHQVRQYFQAYCRVARIDASEMNYLDQLYGIARAKRSEGTSVEYSLAMRTFLRESLLLGRKMWTQFDLMAMIWGAVALLLCCATGIISLLSGLGCSSGVYLGGVIGLVVGSSVFYTLKPSMVLLFGILGTQFGYLSDFVHLKRSLSSKQACAQPFSIAMVILILFHALALLSNSYIIAEDRVFLFLSTSCGCFLMFFAWTNSIPGGKALRFGLLFLVAGRLPSMLPPINVINNTKSFIGTIAPVGGTIFIAMQRSSRIGVISCLLCVIYWIVDIENNVIFRIWLPRVIYGITVLSLFRPGLYLSLIAALWLVLGPTSPIVILCLTLQLRILQELDTMVSIGSSTTSMCLYIISSHFFFLTGHHTSFTRLQNAAGLIGFDEFLFYPAGILLGFNTFGVFVIVAMILSSFPSMKSSPMSYLTFQWLFTVAGVISTIFVGIQRRHLMVWAIFAPKFIYDGILMITINVILIASWNRSPQ